MYTHRYPSALHYSIPPDALSLFGIPQRSSSCAHRLVERIWQMVMQS